MATNSGENCLTFDRDEEWRVFERLPPLARQLLREAYTHFASRDVEYLLSQGQTVEQIVARVNDYQRADCIKTYGPDHPQAGVS